nr:YlcI/YnfO family protein [uncultured Oscillibacter sp.]
MRKFKIPDVPDVPVSATKSIRFPTTVINQVEEAIRGTNCTFTAFVVEAVRVALENLAEEEEE